MSLRNSLFGLVLLGWLALPFSTDAITPWDQGKATALAKQLSEATVALYDAFYKQPTATVGSGQARAYYRLKQEVRRIKAEARALAKALEKGEGRDETLSNHEQLTELVRTAEEDARMVFSGADVKDKANAVRALLEQLRPYYDMGEAAATPPG